MPRFRRRRGSARRARSFVRRTVSSMGPIEAKRILLEGVTIADRTTNPYDNPTTVDLLVCQETVNEETESNGTTIAECPLYSKLVGMKLNLYIQGAVSEALNARFLLYKLPDGESLTSTLEDAFFHSSDDTPVMRELRSVTLAKGIFHLNESQGATRIPIFVKRKTLRRLGKLRENDRIRLYVAIDGVATTQPKIYGMGTLYVRMN